MPASESSNIAKPRHVLVVGAGIVGASCAWCLVEQGFTVTLVDRGEPGQATSYGNAACISPSQVVPFSHPGAWKKIPGWLADELGPLTIRWKHLPWVAPWLLGFLKAGEESRMLASARAQAQLMHQVNDDYQWLLSGAGQAHYLRHKGLVIVYDTPQQFESDRWIYNIEAELGFAWQELSADETKERIPALSLPEGRALYVPSWQHTVNPGKMTAGIAEAATAAGATFRTASVHSVQSVADGIQANLEGGGQLNADAVVIAAGPWSNHLVAPLDGVVPMTAKRGYHSMVASPGFELDTPVMSATRSFVMTPLEEGLRLAGTAEFAKLDAEPNYRRADVLLQHAGKYFPDFQPEGVTQWMGQRPMMVDSVPVISPSPSHDNIWYAFGHGHYGLTQGPTTGRLITAMLQGRDTELDMTPYRIDRF